MGEQTRARQAVWAMLGVGLVIAVATVLIAAFGLHHDLGGSTGRLTGVSASGVIGLTDRAWFGLAPPAAVVGYVDNGALAWLTLYRVLPPWRLSTGLRGRGPAADTVSHSSAAGVTQPTRSAIAAP